MKKIVYVILIIACIQLLFACKETDTKTTTPNPTEPTTTNIKGWNGESISYDPADIANLNAATPQGYAIINPNDPNSAIIRSLSPELNNYGGVSTGILTLNFNYAVIFSMDVVSVYNQYIVKLFVEGEPLSYYVLSDEGKTGFISINIVDSMLSDKYRERNTQPDPGYATGWKYANQIKNCYFYIMPKGPDGEIRTAELVLRNITITNFNAPSIQSIEINGSNINNQEITQLKASPSIQLSAVVTPNLVADSRVFWSSEDSNIASVNQNGLLTFTGVGITNIYATSVIDQSKRGVLKVNVTSGYENPQSIITYLNGLNINAGGIVASTTVFDDIYRTTWGDQSIYQKIRRNPVLNPSLSVEPTVLGHRVLLENYFNPSNSSEIIEAQNESIPSVGAGYKLQLAGNNLTYNTTASATIYRKINNMIYKETISSTNNIEVMVRYALLNGSLWTKTTSYDEQTIVVWGNGQVTKYEVFVKGVTLIKSYQGTDFLNTNFWRDGNTMILAPGSVRDNFDGTVTIREENPTIFKYGGIISELITIDGSRKIEIILEITETNPSRVMWDIRILYFRNEQRLGNPLSIEASNRTGRFMLDMIPVTETFRIYLIANGSDIGTTAPGAEVKIRSLKIQYIDE
jgi:hypothetical protein